MSSSILASSASVIPSNPFCIKTAGIFLHSHCCCRKLPYSDWLLMLFLIYPSKKTPKLLSLVMLKAILKHQVALLGTGHYLWHGVGRRICRGGGHREIRKHKGGHFDFNNLHASVTHCQSRITFKKLQA